MQPFTGYVKLKVIHFLRRMDRIRRDLEELDKLQNAIQKDREYSHRLKDTFLDESQRLKKLQSRMLNLIVKNPPVWKKIGADATIASSELAASASPEVILPGKGSKRRSISKKQSEDAAGLPSAEQENKQDRKSKEAPFQFRYN